MLPPSGDAFFTQSESDRCQIIKQEKNILLVLNELCRQIVPSDSDSAASVAPTTEIDLLSVAQKLQESGMSVK